MWRHPLLVLCIRVAGQVLGFVALMFVYYIWMWASNYPNHSLESGLKPLSPTLKVCVLHGSQSPQAVRQKRQIYSMFKHSLHNDEISILIYAVTNELVWASVWIASPLHYAYVFVFARILSCTALFLTTESSQNHSADKTTSWLKTEHKGI